MPAMCSICGITICICNVQSVNCQFHAHDRPDPRGLRGLVKARHAVEAVAIDQGHGGVSSAAARSARVSGSEAPRRKEKAEAVWSSMYTGEPN